MFHRPKPGETEEDLLEFQKQFLTEKLPPSASITKNAGDKRTADRDVVQLHEISADNQVPVAKKSKFRASRELNAKMKQERDQLSVSQDGDIIDEHDTSSATVLSKIIERDTRHVVHSLPNPVELPFPSLSQISGAKAQFGKKKQSLFAQHFALDRDQLTDGQSDILNAVNVGITMETDNDQASLRLSGIIDGSGLSATFGKSEVKKIHEENLSQLSVMSEEEILSEQQKVYQMLDPEVIKFMKDKCSKSVNKKTECENKLQIIAEKPVTKSSKKYDVDIPVDIKKDWVHMDNVECDKLEWMRDLPPPQIDGIQSGQTARFDFQGNLVQSDIDIPMNIGLHHHGDEPERAGYSLEELFTLARSTNSQQKVIALTTLSKIIKQTKEGNLSSFVQSPIIPSLIDAGVIFLLRWSLDDSMETVITSAVAALNSLLVNHADAKALNKVFHWYQGHRITCQVPSEPDSVGIKLPDDADEKPELTDVEVAKKDVIKALGTRMNFVQRLTYILDVVKPQAPTVICILQILTKMCRHSRNMAYEVFKCPRLVDIIISEFVPASWSLLGMTECLSNVYGVPLKEAITLIYTMCQAGRNVASLLLSKYQMEERLIRFLIADVKDIGLSVIESHGLQMACYNMWKVCLAYGLADNVYIMTYPKIVETLRTSFDDIELNQQSLDRLSALISCLEMVVCVAGSSIKQHGFNQNVGNSELNATEGELVLPNVNWSHVADLIQPVKLLLQNSLSHVAQFYQIKKQSLQLPTVCMNFITAFYIHSQSQFQGEDIINSLQNMEEIYKDTLQHWSSIGFQYLVSSLRSHSNLIPNSQFKNLEKSRCLPEFSNSSLLEELFVPTVRKDSPFGFLSAFCRLVYYFSKLHPGLKIWQNEPGLSPLVVLQSTDLKNYFKKIVTDSLSHLASNMFTKFEIHLLYYALKLSTEMATVEKDQLDLTTLHCLSLKLLSILHHGDEHIAHDLLSTVVFNSVFIRSPTTVSTTMMLERLNLTLPTHIQSATTQDMEILTEKLLAEAQENMFAIRTAYLASMSQNEKFVTFSRNHYLGITLTTTSCFTSNIEEFLLPQDWMFSPLIDLHNKFLSVGADVQNVLSNSQLDVVRSVLRWIYVMETCRSVAVEGISVTLRLSRIMCTFLTGNEMFLDHIVQSYLAGLLKIYTHPFLLRKIDFSEDIPGLPSFYDLYVSLIQQFEALSFGDSVFSCYLLLPLQQRYDVMFRKAIWTEYTGIMRILSLPLNQLMIPLELYLEPEETNVELLRLYYQSLYSGILQPKWSPVLYLIAVHHVNRFVYTKGKTHQKLKLAMMQQLMNCKNKELRQHIVHYMKADITKPFGMILFDILPDIRQRYINQLGSECLTTT